MAEQSLKIDHVRYILTLDPRAPHHPGRRRSSWSTAASAAWVRRPSSSDARADRVIDGRHMVVTPGFFNGHMHISYAHPVRGIFPDEQASPLVHVFNLQTAMTEDEEYHATLLGLVELLRRTGRCASSIPAARSSPTRACRPTRTRASA